LTETEHAELSDLPRAPEQPASLPLKLVAALAELGKTTMADLVQILDLEAPSYV